MGRSSPPIVLVYIAVAAFLLLLLAFSPSHPDRPHRRLKLRSFSGAGAGGRHAAFDPIIADIERLREDREWERAAFFGGSGGDGEHAPAMEAAPEWASYVDAEDYINDEERFNVTRRVEVLFPLIDVSPADGDIALEELVEWNLAAARRESMHRTQRDFELHDRNKDGLIAFSEYSRPIWAWRFEDNTTNNGMGWWKEDHFNASDIDSDGLLNMTEFNDFLHPSDSNNPKLIHWLCEEEIKERDKDNDGKLNFQEFFNGLFSFLRMYEDESGAPRSVDSDAQAKKLFARLDQDQDGLLSPDEVKPVIGMLHPSEHFYAKQQAEYTISQADSNKDGKLSMQEMIDNPYVFYSAIFGDDDFTYHDEFR